MSYQTRLAELRERAAGGSRWSADLARYAPPGFADFAPALVRWIGIESSGDNTVVSSEGERGLTQVPTSAPREGWITRAEWQALIDRSTPHETLARLAWKHFAHLDDGHPSAWDTDARAWRAYMRHGLPALYTNLVASSYLVGDGPAPGGTLDAAWTNYDPGALGRFAASGSGTVGQRLLNRIVTAADAVAGYQRDAWNA